MIDVIIPNWNGRQLLKTCLDSLSEQSYRDFQITVVDNGSGDGSVEYLETDHAGVRVVALSANHGFSAAVNRGIESTERPWVMLLNNDTETAPDCLENLAKACQGYPEYDFYALKMIDYRDRRILDGAGDAVLRGGVGYRMGTWELDGERYALRREVFGACAGAALYRRRLFERVGLFDEDFFAYLEDVDLNLRAVRAGSRCCFLPEARIYHIGSASTGSKINEFTIRLSTRNNGYVMFKNYTPYLWFRFLPAIIIYQLFWLLLVLKKGQFGAYISGVGALFRGLPEMLRKGRRFRKSGGLLTEKRFAGKIIEAERQAVESIINRRREQGRTNRLLKLYLKLFCRAGSGG